MMLVFGLCLLFVCGGIVGYLLGLSEMQHKWREMLAIMDEAERASADRIVKHIQAQMKIEDQW